MEINEVLKKMEKCESDRVVDSKFVQTDLTQADIDELLIASSDELPAPENLSEGYYWSPLNEISMKFLFSKRFVV